VGRDTTTGETRENGKFERGGWGKGGKIRPVRVCTPIDCDNDCARVEFNGRARKEKKKAGGGGGGGGGGSRQTVQQKKKISLVS